MLATALPRPAPVRARSGRNGRKADARINPRLHKVQPECGDKTPACCCGVSFGGRPMCRPRSLARLRPSAVRVRIGSQPPSTSPPRTAIVSRPVLVAVSAQSSTSDRNCPRHPRSASRSRTGQRSPPRRPIRVTATTPPGARALEQPRQRPPGRLCPARLLAVNPRAPQTTRRWASSARCGGGPACPATIILSGARQLP